MIAKLCRWKVLDRNAPGRYHHLVEQRRASATSMGLGRRPECVQLLARLLCTAFSLARSAPHRKNVVGSSAYVSQGARLCSGAMTLVAALSPVLTSSETSTELMSKLRPGRRIRNEPSYREHVIWSPVACYGARCRFLFLGKNEILAVSSRGHGVEHAVGGFR